MADERSPIPAEIIEQHIFLIRGQKVMLDYDLAKLYEVATKSINQAVKRNLKRFPGDFMLQLTFQEVRGLRSQIVTLKRGQHLKYRPYAFTEHGILMISSVLNSERAVQVNIEIMRAFVRLRALIASNKDLAPPARGLAPFPNGACPPSSAASASACKPGDCGFRVAML